mgnify:CR=1 FL=1
MCLRDVCLIKMNYICNYWLKITNIKMADNQENQYMLSIKRKIHLNVNKRHVNLL